MAILLIALIAGLGALSLFIRLAAGARRRRRYFDFASRFGLNYSPVDRLGLIDHSFDLFNLADGAACQDVVWGIWHGVPVRTGELRFTPSAEGLRERRHGSKQAFSFAFTEIPAWLPHLAISRSAVAGFEDALGRDRFRTESEAFNRTFDVECDDREFAYKFVDVRLMEWLLDVAQPYGLAFEVRGPRLLVSGPLREPDGLVPLLGAAKEFHQRVPAMVLREYATGASSA